jgi:hypothetical protein
MPAFLLPIFSFQDYASGSKVGNCVNMKFSSGTMGRTRGIKAAAPPPPGKYSSISCLLHIYSTILQREEAKLIGQ